MTIPNWRMLICLEKRKGMGKAAASPCFAWETLRRTKVNRSSISRIKAGEIPRSLPLVRDLALNDEKYEEIKAFQSY